MGKPALVPIRTLDELKKILFIQMSVTQQAKHEMLAIASEPDNVSQPHKFIEGEKQLLEKYAKYPTLSEFAADPRLANVYKWGATFGVAAIIGGLILEEVRHRRPHFETVLRQMYLVLLKELNHPEHQYLVEPLEKALRVKVEPTPDSGATPEEAQAYVRQVIHELIESYVIVSSQYGLMTSDGKTVSLTHIGRRVLLHLADVQLFIDDMTKAHKKFQSIKPKLSMA
jgi:hypothetical protein